MEEESKFASSKEDLLRVGWYLIKDRERFRSEASGFAFPEKENAAAVVDDGWAAAGDVFHGPPCVWVEAYVPIEGERGLVRSADGVAGKLFMRKDRVVGPATRLLPGADGDLGRAAFGVLSSDLDLLH